MRLSDDEDNTPMMIDESYSTGFSSIIGTRAENQDTYFHRNNIQKGYRIIGVYDGHGDLGEVASKKANTIIGKHIDDTFNLDATENPDEKARIIASGGRVVLRGQSWRVLPKLVDFNDDQIAKKRLALNMSRSIGHIILSNYGIISTPDIVTRDLSKGDIIIVASDGLWNVIDYNAIPKLIQSFSGDPQNLSNYLVFKRSIKKMSE
eukprot:gene2907-3341_t